MGTALLLFVCKYLPKTQPSSPESSSCLSAPGKRASTQTRLERCFVLFYFPFSEMWVFSQEKSIQCLKLSWHANCFPSNIIIFAKRFSKSRKEKGFKQREACCIRLDLIQPWILTQWRCFCISKIQYFRRSGKLPALEGKRNRMEGGSFYGVYLQL